RCLPAFVCAFVERAVAVLPPAAAGDVVEHVEAAENLERERERFLNLFGIAHVAADGQRRSSGRVRQGNNTLVAVGFIEANDSKAGAFFEKAPRRGPADSRSAADDQTAFVTESHGPPRNTLPRDGGWA